MCRPVTCKTCQKTTWAGCGEHVDDVMRDVPTQQRCVCGPTVGANIPAGGIFSRLFGRG